MREIGSEFWDLPVLGQNNGLFPESTQWFLSGRSALKAIITELRGTRSISIPSWFCNSMIRPFIDAGWIIKFYPVTVEQQFKQEIALDTDTVFIMDYFGYTSSSTDLNNYRGIVIRDVTHSVFSASHADADYYFGSLRKWCGVWTGGYAWTRDEHILPSSSSDDRQYVALRKRAMQEKAEYINGKRTDKEYLKIFEEAECALENIGIASAANRDMELATRLDVEMIISRRRANAEILMEAFPDWLIFPTLAPTDTPMFVPVLVPHGKRDALRRHLINHEIYCPVHWPVSIYHRLDDRTEYIYQNELSLVCDQRYTVKDMNRIVETIKGFMEG